MIVFQTQGTDQICGITANYCRQQQCNGSHCVVVILARSAVVAIDLLDCICFLDTLFTPLRLALQFS